MDQSLNVLYNDLASILSRACRVDGPVSISEPTTLTLTRKPTGHIQLSATVKVYVYSDAL